MPFFRCLFFGMLLLNSCVAKSTELYNESIKTMNQTESITKGQFAAKDKQGVPILMEWQKTTLFAPEFAMTMKEVWPLACQAYTPVEMQFLRKYPQVVGTEGYFKLFEPLFKDGLNNVNWALAEKVQKDLLKTHFFFDTASWGPEVFALYAKDVCYVVTVKDEETNELRGFITFMNRANYAKGDIKVMSFAVDQSYQNRGYGRLLMSSILKITSDIERIFLCTRVTNEVALKAYSALGFIMDNKPIMEHDFNLAHWTFLEYIVNKSDVLQKTAEGFKVV